jgi:tetratricopeptide (TPR) repeat protein
LEATEFARTRPAWRLESALSSTVVAKRAIQKNQRKDRSPRPSQGSAPRGPALQIETTWIFAIVLGCAVLGAYLPALAGDFLWDDDAHVTRPELRSLNGLWRIWFDLGATQQYYPLLHSSFWLEHLLWGNSVVGYHLVNVLFHVGSSVLLLVILRRLEVPGAALAAGIFALHPVHVESVAWISEQKNTLSLVLYLGALYLYLRFDQERRIKLYLAASAFFVLGVLTKTVVATLAGALLVIFWWRRGRLSWRRDVLPLLPWFALAAVSGLSTAWIEQRLLGAEGADFALSPLQRAFLAGRVLWFYLGKLVWPVGLTFVYPRWTIEASIWPEALFAAAALAVVVSCWMVRGRSRAPLAVALLFIGGLFPVLGFLNVYPFVFSFVADNFVYVASLGVIAGAAAGASRLSARLSAGWFGPLASVALLGTLGLLTWRQAHDYTDAVTLYDNTLSRNPDCYLCRNNLGMLSLQAGESEQAIEDFKEAVRIKPGSAEAHNNLGNLLVQSGSVSEGITHYERALEIAPNDVGTRTNLGSALFLVGRTAEAKEQFEASLRIMPDYLPARQKLSILQSLPQR